VPLVRAFQTALRQLGVRGKVVVTDVNPLSPAVHVADRWYLVPLSTDPSYLDAIFEICDAERIALVVPTIDDELTVFGEAVRRFEHRGIRLAVSAEPTSRLCGDKFECCRFLRRRGIAAAESFLPNAVPEGQPFPLFIKPRRGRGGVGAFPLRSPRELEFFRDYVADPIIQEYLDGPEYTIDVLCDFHGRPLSIVPRERAVIRAGVIDRGRTVSDERLMDLALQVTRMIPFAGPLNIQCRMVGDRPVIFEINPRFSGGIPLTIAAGADFPKMLIELTLGRPVARTVGQFRDGLWMTNYESSVFVDAATVAAGGRASVLKMDEVA
jgi:carbamoyl-phosphate synthase large subunit